MTYPTKEELQAQAERMADALQKARDLAKDKKQGLIDLFEGIEKPEPETALKAELHILRLQLAEVQAKIQRKEREAPNQHPSEAEGKKKGE